MLLAQSGDRDALESILRDVQTNLLRYISGLVGASRAEDVLQDVFVEIWRIARPGIVSPVALADRQPGVVQVSEAGAAVVFKWVRSEW